LVLLKGLKTKFIEEQQHLQQRKYLFNIGWCKPVFGRFFPKPSELPFGKISGMLFD
jgi:hypothetical protein